MNGVQHKKFDPKRRAFDFFEIIIPILSVVCRKTFQRILQSILITTGPKLSLTSQVVLVRHNCKQDCQPLSTTKPKTRVIDVFADQNLPFVISSLDNSTIKSMTKTSALKDHKEEEEIDEGMGSADEALLEMLGLQSLDTIVLDEKGQDTGNSRLPSLSSSDIVSLVESSQLVSRYQSESVCMFPQEFSISADYMRKIAEELVWGGDSIQADRTYETIQVWKNGFIEQRRTLTRLECFVDAHQGWSDLCHGYVSDIVSAALGERMVLYKEKLNLKPPGGSGFAPHLDEPSLRVALGPDGPQTFVTVMIASKSRFTFDILP